MKPELKNAIMTDGPAHAIYVCSERTPTIAQSLSDDPGWYVNRVGLNPRNNQTAIPDAWERKVLQKFDQRQADGESAEKMTFSEGVDGEFRFMKAQGVQVVCLNCHAADIIPETAAALEEEIPSR